MPARVGSLAGRQPAAVRVRHKLLPGKLVMLRLAALFRAYWQAAPVAGRGGDAASGNAS